MRRAPLSLAAAVTLAISTAGCGGGSSGGGAGVQSAPAPPGASPSSAVDIFQSPSTQEFASIGTGADLRIRYDASSNKYEVMAEGDGWVRLVDDPLSMPIAGNPNTNFAFAGAGPNQSFFLIRAHYSYDVPEVRYLYSNLAAWAYDGQGGYVAFGMATPSSGVPVTGTSTYDGMIEGSATDTYFDGFVGAVAAGSVNGTIKLVFDFGGGTLSGSISPKLYLDTTYPLGTFTFENTIYSAGGTSFSGRFATNAIGVNGFSGQFTGPNAQELIGKFALPYISPVNGKDQQSQGAFIAKR